MHQGLTEVPDGESENAMTAAPAAAGIVASADYTGSIISTTTEQEFLESGQPEPYIITAEAENTGIDVPSQVILPSESSGVVSGAVLQVILPDPEQGSESPPLILTMPSPSADETVSCPAAPVSKPESSLGMGISVKQQELSSSTPISTDANRTSDIDRLDEYIRSPEVQNAIVERSPGGRYVRFLEKLGSGASKDVYRAYDTQEGIEVAWNVVNLSGVPKSERNRIVNEVRLLERLHHQNIISFHGSWVNRERQEVNFVTEILSSGTLKSFINKVQLIRWKIAKRWATQILKGLEYLHSQDPPVIHRDLKAENIFINGTSGDLRIGDLGLSTVHRNGRVLSVLGTPEFMAPDMYEEGSYDVKVDIYAFGMVLLEIFTKEIPYSECMNPAQIYKKVSAGEPPEVLKRLESRHARDFVRLCLGYKDEAGNYIRPTATELLQHPFLEIREGMDDEEVLVRPPLRATSISEVGESSAASSPLATPSKTRSSTSNRNRANSNTEFEETLPDDSTNTMKMKPGHRRVESTNLTHEEDDDDRDRFEEMPESETNMKKVKVLMGRDHELEDTLRDVRSEDATNLDRRVSSASSVAPSEPRVEKDSLNRPTGTIVDVQNHSAPLTGSSAGMRPEPCESSVILGRPRLGAVDGQSLSTSVVQVNDGLQRELVIESENLSRQHLTPFDGASHPIGLSSAAVSNQDVKSDTLNRQYLVAAAVVGPDEPDSRPYPDDILNLVVILPVNGQTQNVQFPFHLIRDDPVQVAREMVEELNIPSDAVLEISQTISGLARTARMKVDSFNSRSGQMKVSINLEEPLNSQRANPPKLMQPRSGAQPTDQSQQPASQHQDLYPGYTHVPPDMAGHFSAAVPSTLSVPVPAVVAQMHQSIPFQSVEHHVGKPLPAQLAQSQQALPSHMSMQVMSQLPMQANGYAQQPPLPQVHQPPPNQYAAAVLPSNQSLPSPQTPMPHIPMPAMPLQVQPHVSPLQFNMQNPQTKPFSAPVVGVDMKSINEPQIPPAAQTSSSSALYQATPIHLVNQTTSATSQITAVNQKEQQYTNHTQVPPQLLPNQAAPMAGVPQARPGFQFPERDMQNHSEVQFTSEDLSNKVIFLKSSSSQTVTPQEASVASPHEAATSQHVVNDSLRTGPSTTDQRSVTEGTQIGIGVAGCPSVNGSAGSASPDGTEDIDIESNGSDSELDEELRKLEEDFKRNLQRTKKVYDTRMESLQRSQLERETQHLKTLERHEKERHEFEKRLAQEEEQQNRRLEQLQREWQKKRAELAESRRRAQEKASIDSDDEQQQQQVVFARSFVGDASGRSSERSVQAALQAESDTSQRADSYTER